MPSTTFITLLASSMALAADVYTGSYSGSQITYTVTQDTGGDVPLASKHFEYPYLPYQADSGNGPRGRQQGYNICNSTTLGAESWCQTGFVNSAADFCLWGSPNTNETVADTEEEMVAYCTTPNYGSRVLPEGSITGLQFIQTPDYVEVVGFIDQTALDLQADDYGGEEDPHGADERGNPLGSLLYSSAFGAGKSSPYKQVTEWSYFIGAGVFCFKACDPDGDNAASLCNHIYDRVGCTYNDPVSYSTINGTFSSCKGANQLPPGVYVEDGKTTTWYQPAESLGPISSIPYSPVPASTSQCTTYSSNDLFTALTTRSIAPTSAASSAPSASSLDTASATAVNAAASESDSSSAVSLVAMSATSLVLLVASSFWVIC